MEFGFKNQYGRVSIDREFYMDQEKYALGGGGKKVKISNQSPKT
jgi:hypothetical protein